jgi:hypothetical protein
VIIVMVIMLNQRGSLARADFGEFYWRTLKTPQKYIKQLILIDIPIIELITNM